MSHAKPRQSIAVDAMGAENGTAEVVRAVQLALTEIPDLGQIVLVGKARLLTTLLRKVGLDKDQRITIFPATEVITMEDKPVEAMKRKKDASMLRAIELVRSGECGAMVSCGNTGALMAAGTVRLRQLPGVERPSLAPTMPSPEQHFVLLDAGANHSAKPIHLVHQAVLGSNYARVILGVKKPRVGLLSIGTEESKGNELILETNRLLKLCGGLINYHGPIEGFDVFSNEVDVIVTDGFTGNVVLKTCEGLFKTLKAYLKSEIMKNPVRVAGGLLSKGAFTDIKKRLDPDRYGGAPLLGLNGMVIKAHGSSNHTAIMNAIRTASLVLSHDLRTHSVNDIAEANRRIAEDAARE